jgi:hypothetical protein
MVALLVAVPATRKRASLLQRVFCSDNTVNHISLQLLYLLP